ncbi:MAG TPA: ABC-F family ATP-binding cassette domain-containing protein [Chthoniobacterales bacterium]
MLTVSKLSKSFGGRTLFHDASLQMNSGERVGLVGPNGAGKSTLISLILGEASPDDGSVTLDRRSTVGFLPQETAPAGDENVLEIALSHRSDIDDYEAEPKAKRILHGLAFRETDFERPARHLSGGWIMRAHLARLLVQEPDLLILDEPTNHLDLETLVWFRDYLSRYPGAILVISHDRDFLDHLVGSIVEIKHSRLTRWRGNYSSYLEQSAARDEQQAAAYKNQQREIEALQRFADRFRAKASKASQAQSKLKQIERMERIEAPLANGKSIGFRFPSPPRSGQRVMSLDDISHAYGDTVVYRNLNYTVEREQRTVFCGPNGAGKSTLLKLLAGVLPVQTGERISGHNVKAGYYSQNRIDMLNPRQTCLESVLDMPSPVSEETARTVLGSFLFRGDDVFKPVAVLSGGEKSRLALVKLLLDPPNLLLMDEPTTHLDIASIDALIAALKQYNGTLLFISHDVYFIRQLATSVLHVHSGQVRFYPGDYQYYLDKSNATSERAGLTSGRPMENAAPVISQPPSDKSMRAVREERKRLQMERQTAAAKRRELEKHAAALEAEVVALEKQQAEFSAILELPDTYADPGKAMQINRQLMGIAESLEHATAEWERAAAEAEEAEKTAAGLSTD